MDELVFLGIIIMLAVLAVPVAIVVLFLRQSAMADRIARLEYTWAERAHAIDEPSGAAPAGTTAQTTDKPAQTITPEPLAVDPAAAPPTAAPPLAAPEPPSAWDRAVGKMPAAAMSAATADTAQSGASMRRTGSTGPDTQTPPAPQPALPQPALSQPALPHENTPLAPSRMDALIAWLQTNWIYAISAASLGLAGIFFVQYGMEKGLLPPALRVIMAILFGGALIGAGEWLRRRHGDEGDTTTIYLPSVFSGAGLVSIFAATLAARHMYGLISPEVAFAGHLFTAALAVALGWFYGPLLAAVGLIGAALSPFIVAGGSDAAPWLYAYFALIASVGLGIDAVRQWRWLSVLGLVIGYAGAFAAFAGDAGAVGFAMTMVILAAMAVIIPPLSLTPRHPAPFALQAWLGQSGGARPAFATRLATAAAVTSTAFLSLMTFIPADFSPLLTPLMLTMLALGYLLWARHATGLADLALPPAMAFLAILALHPAGSAVFHAYQGFGPKSGAQPSDMANFIPLIVLMAAAISAAAIWRALRRQDWLLDLIFGLVAVLAAPATIAILELLWAPAPVIGLPFWAALIIGTAALMTWLATRFAAIDMGDMRRAAYATLSALSLVALALFLMTTATALTLALGVLILVAAFLDRRFNLPEMGLFQQIGVAVLSYRLLFDPGVTWAVEGPLLQVILGFAGAIAAMVGAWFLILPHRRSLTRAVLESAASGLTAIFVDLMLLRWLIPDMSIMKGPSYWQLTLWAMPWLVLMLAQLYRAGASETLRRLRIGLATVAGAIAAVFLALAALPFNPLLSQSPTDTAGLVQGPALINTLFLAYAIPGLLLLFARHRMTGLDRRVRLGLRACGTALLALYATLAIRHVWQGAWIGGQGIAQGELYSYTLAMMALGAGLLLQAIRKGSASYRRAAMGVIGLVIAKVFLIDAAGLTGLTRVFSFLGLGLSLAGLAWLNRWADRTTKGQ